MQARKWFGHMHFELRVQPDCSPRARGSSILGAGPAATAPFVMHTFAFVGWLIRLKFSRRCLRWGYEPDATRAGMQA